MCTIGSPAIAKNVLAVGATSAGETRLNSDGIYDIDHVASLSSWGFTKDGRVKPEVVAPGDTVGGGDLHKKKLPRVVFFRCLLVEPNIANCAAQLKSYARDLFRVCPMNLARSTPQPATALTCTPVDCGRTKAPP